MGRVVWFACALLSGCAARAGAGAGYPLELIARPNTLPAGMLEGRVDLIASLATGHVFEPFFLAPDVAYGVSDTLQLGLVHTTSLCLAGDSHGCPLVYNGGSLDVLVTVLRDGVRDLNVHGDVDLDLVEDEGDTRAEVGLRLGVFGSIRMSDEIALYFDPQVKVGLNRRDDGNREEFAVPLRVAFRLTPRVTPFLDVSFGGPFGGLGDEVTLPVALGVNYAVSNLFDVGATFGFTDLVVARGEEGSVADGRLFSLYAAYRLGGPMPGAVPAQ